MTKLKCWKKIGYASAGGAYERKDTTSKRIVIDNRGSQVKGAKWFVEKQTWSPTSGRDDTIIGGGNSKREATRKAISYMRKYDKC